MDTILFYSNTFTPFLKSLPWPVALVPPALCEILGDSFGAEELDEAFALLGFRETRAVSSVIADLTASLENEAKRRTDAPLLFSACPEVRAIAAREYPAAARMFTEALPPADLISETAKKDHPDATVFFLSPCSSRAMALLSRGGSGETGCKTADYAVPLESLFPALLRALEKVTGRVTPEFSVCRKGGHSGGTSGRTEFVPSQGAIRSWLQAYTDGAFARHAGTFIELVICPGGCTEGDWAPKL